MPKKTTALFDFLFTTRVSAIVGGKRVEFENNWFRGEKAFLDGEPVWKTNKLVSVSKDVPVAEFQFVGNDGRVHYIEVFARSLLWTEIMLCANGKRVAGTNMRRREEAARARMKERLLDERSTASGTQPAAIRAFRQE